MRNKLIHDYLGVDLEKVWFTTQNDLFPLKGQIQAILTELGCVNQELRPDIDGDHFLEPDFPSLSCGPTGGTSLLQEEEAK